MKPTKEQLHIEQVFREDMSEAIEDALWFQLFDLLGITSEENPQSPDMDKDE